MSVSASLREQIRQTALFACEYCGVSETLTGGELTLDHYRPKSKGGTDDAENLIYACFSCNLHKSDYWPTDDDAPHLWYPRQEPFSTHFRLLQDGWLHPLTEVGRLTIDCLHLNREPLVAHRHFQLVQAAQQDLYEHYRSNAILWEQRARLLAEQNQSLFDYIQTMQGFSGDEP